MPQAKDVHSVHDFVEGSAGWQWNAYGSLWPGPEPNEPRPNEAYKTSPLREQLANPCAHLV
jgi:hypothetical protein